MNRKSKEKPSIGNCDMNRVRVDSMQQAVLFCPRSPEGETRVLTTSNTRSTSLVRKLSKLASESICGGCSYLGKTRIEGERVRAEEIDAEAARINAETELLRVQADQTIARAEIARRLAAAGVEVPAEGILAPGGTPELPAIEPPAQQN